MGPVYVLPYLEGKVAIVTGASSGIGLAVSTALLASGSSVFGVDISPKPSSLESNEKFLFYQGNLAEPSAPLSIYKACTEAFGGRVDILLNVAGIMDTNNSADTLEDKAWDRIIAVNLTAPVLLMREVLPGMEKQKSGSIVNVSSKAGVSGAVAGVAYTASKHGLIGATKNVAWRFKDDGIRCNAICPGAVETNIVHSIDPKDMDMKAYLKMKPIHDIHVDLDAGHPKPQVDDVVAILLFLSSDMSKAISGSIIPVDYAWSTI